MELQELDETMFLVEFHETIEKVKKNAWNDGHIKAKTFAQGDKVLLYDNRYQKHSGNLHMH
jgi:hypothetical protein